MPTNLYGPSDNFDLTSSHVVPALMRKFHEAKLAGQDRAVVWGTGEARRELLHVDDLADACCFLMEHYDDEQHINVGTGVDLSIRELAEEIRRIVAPDVSIEFDTSKPDGAPRKLLDVGRVHRLGWHHTIDLREGLASTYEWLCRQTVSAAHRHCPGRSSGCLSRPATSRRLPVEASARASSARVRRACADAKCCSRIAARPRLVSPPKPILLPESAATVTYFNTRCSGTSLAARGSLQERSPRGLVMGHQSSERAARAERVIAPTETVGLVAARIAALAAPAWTFWVGLIALRGVPG